MELGKTRYVTERKAWRSWLAKHHKKEKEIWLVYYKKHTGKPRIPYNDAVEEALCYGWIDSTVKRLDKGRIAQRFSPRREGSRFSEMNKERARRLIKAGKMTRAGKAKIRENLHEKFVVPEDILRELKEDKDAWAHFSTFPLGYKRVRIGFIEDAREKPAEFRKRLDYFLRMTRKGKQFGMVR